MSSSQDGHYEVYWPRTARQVRRKSLAPRLSTLDGKLVAQLWDFLFRGDEVLALLEEGIKGKRSTNPRLVKRGRILHACIISTQMEKCKCKIARNTGRNT